MDIITPDWPAPAGVRAVTTVRSFWGNAELSASDPRERSRLISMLSLPEEPVWLKQTHSTIVVPAEPRHRDKEADASFTNQTGRVCLVLTADCLPVLVCDQSGNYVAAIHAGWRGLVNGIIENTIQSLLAVAAQTNTPINYSDLLVWLGPAIGPQKFEVGEDVYEAFIRHDASAGACFIPNGHSEKWLANLYELARLRCQQLGITQIFGGDYCTYTQEDLFYSWRRDHRTTGRMASLIWIEKK